MGVKALVQIERLAVSVVSPFREPVELLAERQPELDDGLIVTGRKATRGDEERAAGRELGSEMRAVRQIEIEQSGRGVGIVAIAGHLRREILRRQITDIAAQIGPRIGTLEIKLLTAGGRPQKRKRLLVRQVIVVDARQWILIIQQRMLR